MSQVPTDSPPPLPSVNARLPEASYACKKPCAECPFARVTSHDVRDKYHPLRLIGQAYGPFILPCHMAAGYEEKKATEAASLPQCAGAAVFRSNVGGAPYFPAAFHILPEDPKTVYASPVELLAAYAEISEQEAAIRLWVTPPAALRDMEMQDPRVKYYAKG